MEQNLQIIRRGGHDMLRVLARIPDNGIEVVAEGYLPLTVRVGSDDVRDPLYWRARPDLATLVEVGIDPRSGNLVSFDIVAIPRERVVAGRSLSIGPFEEGVPRVDTDDWYDEDSDGRFLDVDADVRLVVGRDVMMVTLGERAESWWGSGRVVFGVSEGGTLAALACTRLSPAELASVRRAVGLSR